MKDRRTALILIGAAVMFAVGAFLFLNKTQNEPPVHRAEVIQPVEKAPKAPDWVSGSKEVQPDYSSSDAEPKDVTPPPPVVEEKTAEPQTVEIEEDKVVTFTFVESLADFFLLRFQPVGPKGKPATTATAMGLNKYYGRELDGFAVTGDDVRAARQSLLNYAFNPAMLDTLYGLYADAFMIHLVDTAASVERVYKVGDTKEQRTLTTEEIQAMLRLNSRRIERTADLFRAMGSDPEITEMAARYRRSAKAVQRANDQLQDAIADDKDTQQAGERLKSAILQRERNKSEIITALKQICHACTETELFYMSEWGYRRVVSSSEETLKTFTKVSEILDDLAIRFTEKANTMK